MVAVQIRLELPENLAREAQASDLLTPEAIEELLRSEIRRRRVKQLFESADKLASLDVLPMTPSEVEAEIQAARSERRADLARRR